MSQQLQIRIDLADPGTLSLSGMKHLSPSGSARGSCSKTSAWELLWFNVLGHVVRRYALFYIACIGVFPLAGVLSLDWLTV